MGNFLLIGLCILGGYLFKKYSFAPQNAHEGINFFIIYMALPALTLLHIPHFSFDWLSVFPLLTSFLVFGWGLLFFGVLRRLLSWEGRVFACLALVCGLGNTSFVGFPLVEVFYGSEGLKTAILIDQGSFLVLASGGLALAVSHSEGKLTWVQIVRKIVTYPQFLALVLALLFWGRGFPVWIEGILSKISACLVPLALFSVGLQLKFDFGNIKKRFLVIGLAFKLVLAPLFIFVCYGFVMPQGLDYSVAVVEAAMPPMITASILAAQYRLEANLAQLLTGLGIVLGFLSTWLWTWVLA